MNEYKWYRFPIDVIDVETKESYDAIGKNPKEDEYWESWVDIREDQIVAIRPFVPKDSKDMEITGTSIYLSNGDSYVVNVKPSTVKEIIGITTYKFKSIKYDNI